MCKGYPNIEPVNIVVIGETSSSESVPQGSGPREEVERNLLLANGIRREYWWFAAM